MKRVLIVLLLVCAAVLLAVQSAQAAGPTDEASSAASALCMPGIYPESPGDCLPLGPSAYLTDLAHQGITLPMRPLPAAKPDPMLTYLPYAYALLKDSGGKVYATLENALDGVSPVRVIQPGEGLKFISYIDAVDANGSGKPDAFQLKAGGWVSKNDVATRWSAMPRFQGVEFQRTPPNQFGWVNAINASIETKRTPGYAANDYTGRSLPQYSVVQVFAEQRVGEMDWYLVGPDEWVEGRFVGRVIPNTTPPQGVTNGRWIEINLYEQTLAVYDRSQLVFATLIASGVDYYWTRPGLFPIYKMLESTPMSGSFELDRSDFYYLEDVPWTLYYDEARAMHGAYWRARLGFPQSHGCVNMSPGDAQWLFNWAQEGDWVYVWDPSGRTPVDPGLYSEGGA